MIQIWWILKSLDLILKRHAKEQHILSPCNACKKIDSSELASGPIENIHTCERKFQCVTCNKRFHSNSYLQKHNRIHTGEKPYKCNSCDQEFRFEHAMKNMKQFTLKTSKR